MQGSFLDIKTSPELLGKLRNAKTQSAKDNLEQRVSFVLGSMDKDSSVTRDRIREVILEQVGGSVGDRK